MKKFSLILILFFTCHFGLAQKQCEQSPNIDSIFFQDYILSSIHKHDTMVYTSIYVKSSEYSKILVKLTKPKKFEFRKKSFKVENFEINGIRETLELRIIEGFHSKIVNDNGATHFGFSIFENQKDKEYFLKNNNSTQRLGLVIYLEKKGKNKYLSKAEMDNVIEFLKSI